MDKAKSKVKKSNTISSDSAKISSVSNGPFLINCLICLILSFTIFIIYKPAFDHQFVNWDDQVYVEEQPLVLQKQYKNLLKTPISLNYHPVTMISLAAQTPKNINTLSAGPFIKLNVWIHIFNSILVYFLIFLITNKNWIVAFFTAAVFALHPTHVESVAWVSERKDVLYTLFFLSSCISYIKYLGNRSKKWLLLAGILFLFSILSKAMAVVIPLVWLLLDYWQGRKLSDIKVHLEKIPFLLISLLFGLMAVNVQSGGDFGGILTLYGEKTKAVADTNVFTLWQRFQFATYGFVQYILLFFNPTKICAFYPYPDGDKLSGSAAVLYPLTFIAALGGSLWSMHKTRLIAFSIGFYFITVALVLQFMSVGLAIMADRYTYIPYIGLSFLIAYGTYHLVKNKNNMFQYFAVGAAGIFLIFITIKTSSQVQVWKDSESLWTQVLRYYPNEDLALANRGNYRGKTGNIAGAMADFELAISDGCLRADVYEGLGNSYGTMSEQQQDKKQEYVFKAIEMYQKALSLEPGKGNIQYNLGVAQLQTNPAASVTAFTEALKLMPYKENDILPVLGLSLLNSGKYADAVKILTQVIDSGTQTDVIYYHRGLALLGTGNQEAARSDFQQALTINPQNTEVRNRLASLQ